MPIVKKAIPYKFFIPGTLTLRENLTAAEQAELEQYAPREMTAEEIAAIEQQAAEHEATELAERPGKLKAFLAKTRWEFEESGTAFGGFPVDTSRDSQNKIMAEVMRINLGMRPDGALWKYADGEFRAIANADFPALAQVVAAHVAAAYAAEAQVIPDIENGSLTTEQEVADAFIAATSIVA